MSETISESEISGLKRALFAQQSLLQKLQNELDAEREASASAASEALSVILRLQREKAAIILEAEQYKRFSDQKMSHAEESLAIIVDIIYHKEMEVAALDCQVEAYRYKLLSMGCQDFDSNGDTKSRECLCDNGFMERQILGHSFSSFRHRNESCSWDVDSGESLDSDRNINDDSVYSYWEQIRKLDAPVNEVAGADRSTVDPTVEKRPPQTSGGNGGHVLDVFEVPQIGPKKVLKPDNFEPRCDASIECLGVVGPGICCSLEPRHGCCRVHGTSEIEAAADRDEGLRLFDEIKESLNSLREEIKGLKEKESVSKKDEPSLCALSEAMVYFWL